MAQPNGKEVRLLVIVDGFNKDYLPYYRDDLVPRITSEAFQIVNSVPSAVLKVELRFRPSELVGESQLGLTYNGNQAKCYFDYDHKVLENVYAEAGQFVPDRYLVILAGYGPGGCADGTVMFVRENVLPEVLAHEMGHSFAGMFDEYGADPGQPDACLRWRNCASDPHNTPWTQGTTLGAYPGCDGYSTYLFHPASICLMATTLDDRFCPVCEEHLNAALTKGLSPTGLQLGSTCISPTTPQVWKPPSPPGVATDLDVVAVLTEKTIRALTAIDVPRTARDPEIITGDVVAVARRAGEIVDIRSLAIDSDRAIFTARSAKATFERRVPRDARLVRFTLYGVTKAQVLAGTAPLELELYRSREFRSSFYADDRTRSLLTVPNKIGKTYALNEALVAAW